MAVPKRKVLESERDKRRSSHWKLETPALSSAPDAASFVSRTEYARPAAHTTDALL